MKPNRLLFCLQLGAVTVVMLLLIPVIVIGAFFGRLVLVVAVASALALGLVLYGTSPRFRAWFATFGEPMTEYKGLRLANDVALAPNHAWARTDRGGFVVGSDDVAPTVLGPVSTVELPQLGRWFQRGEPIAHLRRDGRSIALRAPISGTIVGRNDALHLHPELVNDHPYADGWIVRMKSDPERDELRWLRRGRRARAWFRDETDRLVGNLLSRSEADAVLADGGHLVDQVYRQIDDEAWQRVTKSFFGAGDGGGAR